MNSPSPDDYDDGRDYDDEPEFDDSPDDLPYEDEREDFGYFGEMGMHED